MRGSGGVRERSDRSPDLALPEDGEGEDVYGATIASGLVRWRLTISLLSAPR